MPADVAQLLVRDFPSVAVRCFLQLAMHRMSVRFDDARSCWVCWSKVRGISVGVRSSGPGVSSLVMTIDDVAERCRALGKQRAS